MTHKEYRAINTFCRWSWRGHMKWERPHNIPTILALEETEKERFELAQRNNHKEKLLPGDSDKKMRKYYGSRLRGFTTNYLKSNK